MSKHLLIGFIQRKPQIFNKNIRVLQKVNFSTNSDEDKNPKTDEKQKSKEALEKLNNLLKTMTSNVSAKTLDLAKPVIKNKKLKEIQPLKKEDEIEKAAKDVAESLGGDPKQTQSELLMKLLNVTEAKTDLKDLVKGMKVDSEEKTISKAQQVRQILQKEDGRTEVRKSRSERPKPPRTDLTLESVDLFGSQPLGIFTNLPKETSEEIQNKTWDYLYQKELKLAVTHPPSNYFQQMILWTEQGKLWKFPIDNEQDLDEEKSIYFTEHVFLDKYLEPWCPSRGPLRHFMELVCVGLSKNPYITVQDKKEHIEWFRKYFEDKKQLLKETGAIQDRETSQKVIEQN